MIDTLHPQFSGTSFANYRDRTASQHSARLAVQQWVAEADAWHGTQVALLGPHGVGKSHLLYAAAAMLHRELHRRVYCAPWAELADELSDGSSVSHRRMLALIDARIVLVDEVNAMPSPRALDAMVRITSHCWDERIPLPITSNAYPLADLIGAPAASRFAQCVVAGPDGRAVA